MVLKNKLSGSVMERIPLLDEDLLESFTSPGMLADRLSEIGFSSSGLMSKMGKEVMRYVNISELEEVLLRGKFCMDMTIFLIW